MLETNLQSPYVNMEVLKDIPNVSFKIVAGFKCYAFTKPDKKIYRVSIEAFIPDSPSFAYCEYYGTEEEVKDKIQNFCGMIESFRDESLDKIFSKED
jgi:hypothetical protein